MFRFLIFVYLLFVSLQSHAMYYLKFTTSGAVHNSTTSFVSDANTWIDVSVIDTYPTDGPVHFYGSMTGAFVNYQNLKTNVDYANFYFADVPRSVTFFDKSDGSQIVITHGDPVKRFPAPTTPAFLMPDGLLVTAGMSADYDADLLKIFMAATMPVRSMSDVAYTGPETSVFGIPWVQSGSIVHYDANTDYRQNCKVGWAPAMDDGKGFTMLQTVPYGGANNGEICYTTVMSRGQISHVVLFR